MQGVVQSYDPANGDGVIMDDVEFGEYDLAPNALEGSVFPNVAARATGVAELNGAGLATTVRLGSEIDMETPELLPD